MKKKIFILLTAFIAILVISSNLTFAQGNKTVQYVKTISFKGGTCELYELQKNSMFAPADMPQDHKAFMLRLKCTLKNDSDVSETLKVLYDKGEFVAPDGSRYKAGVSTLLNTDEGVIYSLIVGVPKSVDVGTLKFVYGNQTMKLSKDEVK